MRRSQVSPQRCIGQRNTKQHNTTQHTAQQCEAAVKRLYSKLLFGLRLFFHNRPPHVSLRPPRFTQEAFYCVGSTAIQQQKETLGSPWKALEVSSLLRRSWAPSCDVSEVPVSRSDVHEKPRHVAIGSADLIPHLGCYNFATKHCVTAFT